STEAGTLETATANEYPNRIGRMSSSDVVRARRMTRFLAALALLGSTQLWPQNTENAQSAENAADNPKRQELIRAAQKARRAGDHEQALSLAGQAAQIWLTPSLRLFIAEEQSATEQFTNALVNAEACEVE